MSKKVEPTCRKTERRKKDCLKGRYTENAECMYGLSNQPFVRAKEKKQVILATPESFCSSEEPRAMTFAILLQQWQKANEIRLKGGTKTRYDYLIHSHIIPELGDLMISKITVSIINGFLNHKLIDGRLDGTGALSPSYVRSISVIISSALNYAVSEGILPPFHAKINKPCTIKKELSILSVDNQRMLEQHIKKDINPTSLGILISLYTGLRIGEICALSWKDINLDTRTLYIRHTVSRIKSTKGNCKTELILDEPKTPSSKRAIPIPSPLFSTLAEYHKDITSAYVVSGTNHFVSPRTYDARFHRLLKHYHIESFNYHSLRHTFATRCIEAGVDVKTLSEILGHANVSLTLNTYVHSSFEMKKCQLEKLALISV